MALSNKQIKQIREELENCKKPLFFFHDDPDGLCSFLLLYRLMKEGKGVIIKTTPKIDERFLKQVEEYAPDKIFILDIAIVEQEFIDKAGVKVIWIDHHSPLARSNVTYFNPRKENPEDNIPVSYLCYKVVEQDQWISMAGCISDWYWPDFAEDFKKQYPDLLSAEINDPESALFDPKFRNLVETFSYALKGTTQDAMKCVKIFTRINSPYELINNETPAGKYLFKRHSQIKKEYELLLKKALKQKPDGKLIIFTYPLGNMSFTKDVSNEMLHKNPDKIIIIAREKSGEMKISIRSKSVIIPPILEKALEGIEGFGGGHEYACGANVKKKDFDRFIESFKSLLNEN